MALGKTKVAVYNMVDRGRLKPVKIFPNGIMLFSRREVEKFEWPKQGRPRVYN